MFKTIEVKRRPNCEVGTLDHIAIVLAKRRLPRFLDPQAFQVTVVPWAPCFATWRNCAWSSRPLEAALCHWHGPRPWRTRPTAAKRCIWPWKLLLRCAAGRCQVVGSSCWQKWSSCQVGKGWDWPLKQEVVLETLWCLPLFTCFYPFLGELKTYCTSSRSGVPLAMLGTWVLDCPD